MQTEQSSYPVVLSIDDDENSHLILKHAFQKRAVRARLMMVGDGVEAISYLAGEGRFNDRESFPFPQMVLLDWKMPRLGGEGVLEFLGSNPNLRSFPVIVFTSSNAEQDIEKAYALGCDAYAVKPSTFDKLLDFVSALDQEIIAPMSRGEKVSVTNLQGFAIGPRKAPASTTPPATISKLKPPGQDMFQLLVEQVKDYAIYLLDVDGTIRSWNDGARRIKGYEAHEVIGKHFSMFYPQNDRDSEKPVYELRMAREMGRYEEEGWRVRKDGARFWANVIVTPVYDSANKLTGFAKVTRDLTQKKIQEENIQRLLESEERFRLLVDQVKDYAIFMLDARGNIVSWNQGARRLKGYAADEIIGQHFSKFYTPEDVQRDHPANELSIAIREGRYEEEGWRVKKDGSRFWANVVITALWDKRGNLSGFAKVTRDLTIRKEQEDALKRKTEELESFAHTLSHDLRAPLRSIASFTEIIKEEAQLTPRDSAYLEKIMRSTQAMDTLISDILKLSQVSISPVEEKTVALEDLIKTAVAMHEGEITRTHAVVQVRPPFPMVTASATLLVQIFSNLLNNALKFARSGTRPQIEIFSHEHEGICEVHVLDNGVGVPLDVQEKIFNVFHRGIANSSTSGSGVGLAIVKRAVERLGGSVRVRSELGKGSDFIIVIPCHQKVETPVQIS